MSMQLVMEISLYNTLIHVLYFVHFHQDNVIINMPKIPSIYSLRLQSYFVC
jgi:hypothetical protein